MCKFLVTGVLSAALAAPTAVLAAGDEPPAASGSSVTGPTAPDAAATAATAPIDAADSLERITVTATKREQSLQDVPVSVSVTTADTIEKAHIVDLVDLQSVVPSLRVQQFNSVGQTNFTIRGFGNGAGNAGIEGSVGVFIDGVYRSRSSSALDDLPDVDRIEVLRGPQSTLFGKNVSAGAINIFTVKPQFTYGANGSVEFGNFSDRRERFSVTGPISDTLAFRIFGSDETRNGFLTNTTTGHDVNDRNRQSLRADFLWKATSDVTVRVIADYNRIHETCCGVVPLANGPATQFIGAAPPFGLGRPIGSTSYRFDDLTVMNTDPTNKLYGKGVSGQVDWSLPLGTLTSITAKRKQTDESTQDVDFTGADLANKNQASDISTFTQELRFTSKGGPLHYQLGGFYQNESLATGSDITYGSELRGYADGLSGRVPATLLAALPPALRTALAGRSNIYALELLQSLVTPSIVPGSTYFQNGEGIADNYRLHQTSYSIFGNADLDVTDELTLTGGLGYLHDRKRAVSNVVLSDRFSALDLQNVPQFRALGLPPNLYGALGGLQFYYPDTTNHGPVNFPNANESGVLEGSKLTKAFRAAYDLGPATVYASYSTGWKAGAFNLSSDSRPPDANGIGRTAGPENVTLYEVGVKSQFRRGYATLAVFDQAIKGFQSNAYTGTGYALVNAGKESTRGAEVDTAYAPLDWLALTGSATYLKARYDSFTHAPCVTFDTTNCPIDPATGITPAFRDLSGSRPANIPKLSLSVSATVTHDFDRFSAYLRGEYDYSSKVQLSETVPSDIGTFGNRSVNASVGLTNKPQRWEVMLFVRNLFDYHTIVGAFPTVAQTGSYSGFPNQPRTYGITLRGRI